VSPWWRALALFAELSCSLGVGLVVACLARQPTAVPLGLRGPRRITARQRHLWLRVLEPALALAGAGISSWPLPRLRANGERLLRQSGNGLGLTGDELIALSGFSCVTCTLLGALLPPFAELGVLQRAALGALLGAALPTLRERERRARRQKQIDRDLPRLIDLLALCMSAGLDFSGALRLWLERSSLHDRAITDEVESLLQLLRMGHTREQALRAFAEAVPTVAVVDFVHAVVQAEQQGTPLAVVMEIQARMLRLRRSVAGEQAATRAAIWLLLPVLLMLCAILLVLFSPFLLGGFGF
jgi:tight adherence protein C